MMYWFIGSLMSQSQPSPGAYLSIHVFLGDSASPPSFPELFPSQPQRHASQWMHTIIRVMYFMRFSTAKDQETLRAQQDESGG